MREKKSPKNYVIRVHDHPGSVDAVQWNALLDLQPSATPFMRHEYLMAMHESKSASDDTGWQAQFLTLHDGPALEAACPLYLKSHSYGEYMFLCSIVHVSM
jgi:predicted N-acyltransferase